MSRDDSSKIPSARQVQSKGIFLAVNNIPNHSLEDTNGHTANASLANKSVRSSRSPSQDVKSPHKKEQSDRALNPQGASSKRFPPSSQQPLTGWDLKQASKSLNDTLHIESQRKDA